MKIFYLIAFFVLFSTASFSQKATPPATQEKTTVKFYPNPASSTITFEFNTIVERGSKINIYSFLGRQVITKPVSGTRLTLNVSDLMKGIYVFQVKDAEGRIIATNKFQVSH